MPESLKIKKLEHHVSILQQKSAAYDTMHDYTAKRVEALEKLVTLHEQSLEATYKIVTTVKNIETTLETLAKALRFIVILSKWVLTIAGGAAAGWHVIKVALREFL